MKRFFLLFIFMYGFVSLYAEKPTLITHESYLLKTARLAHARSKKNNKIPLCANVSSEQIQKTINFVQRVVQEDLQANRLSRLHDDTFLQEHFTFIPLLPDQKSAMHKRSKFPPGVKEKLNTNFLVTKYASFNIHGSNEKTDVFSVPLYQSSDYQKKVHKTKQEILSGALDQYPRLYKPLVWVTPRGLEKALMQGTTVVTMPSGQQRLFHVHMNNDYKYEVGKSASEQKRYWFFKELKNISALDSTHVAHLLKTELASFAGDLNYFGMGSLLSVDMKSPINKKAERILGFVLDTGSAFVNNRYQLDLFVGLVDSNLFKEKIKRLSEHGVVHMLVKKT